MEKEIKELTKAVKETKDFVIAIAQILKQTKLELNDIKHHIKE